jgi:uncharacterized protein
MVHLTADECRVLGVLVEKAHTVATQYPMSLNSLVTGCNQKSNRNPVININEDRVVKALESLRDKHLVLFANTAGSRVMKYRHNCRETLEIGTNELVVLTELLLRGPQTAGEIRTRASRMHKLGSLEELGNLLQFMMDRAEPLIRSVPPSPGSRAGRYAQLLCPHLHRLDEPSSNVAPPAAASPSAPPAPPAAPTAPAATAPLSPDAGSPGLVMRIEAIEADVRRIARAIEQLADALGEEDILRSLKSSSAGEQDEPSGMP